MAALSLNDKLIQSSFLSWAKHESVPAKVIFDKLKQRGIYVRYFNKEKIDNYLRISIGTDEQMEKLYAALKEIIKEEK